MAKLNWVKELKWKENAIEMNLPGGNGGGIWWTCRGCNGGRVVSVSAGFGGSGIGGSDIRIEFDFGGFGGLGGGFEIWCFAILWILPFSGIYHFMEITIRVNISWFLYMLYALRGLLYVFAHSFVRSCVCLFASSFIMKFVEYHNVLSPFVNLIIRSNQNGLLEIRRGKQLL